MRPLDGPWADLAPIREDLFGVERLEHHAESLAAAQIVTVRPVRVLNLTRRLKANSAILLDAYRFAADVLQSGRGVTPAAEWLLDNYHLVEAQLRQIAGDLPPAYYRELPKLATGPLTGYPRVFGLAWAYVAHTDSLIAVPVLSRFVVAYQRVQPLKIGELWAIAITLRIVLVENMRRLAVQITEAQTIRDAADALIDSVLGADPALATPLHLAVAKHETARLPDIFAAQLARRLRSFDPAETPLHSWLLERLRQQGTSIDDVVARALHRQGASNVTMRNIVTSMRIIAEIDWADFFEEVSLVDARLRTTSNFGAMDFASRNSYRSAIEDLARRSATDEIAVADRALALAASGRSDRARDPGFFLVGAGRRGCEVALGYVPSVGTRARRLLGRMGLTGYLGAIAAATATAVGLAVWAAGAGPGALLPLGLLCLLPSSDVGTALINQLITRRVAPKPLPGMDLAQGVPDDLKTLLAVPVLLANHDDLIAQIERLEVHYLSSVGGAVHYALLSDGPDADSEITALDGPLVEAAATAIARLNATYSSARGDRFLLLHRRRLWNPAEGCWMGWERKRGKLHELNRLLRGATDTTFLPRDPTSPPVPQDVRFVITLDADTRLPRDTVRRLIGKMAHPLNRARFDADVGRVVEGFGIMQPRVTPALPVGQDGSLFQRLYSSPGGIEPYAAAVADVYQDLFGEGSFSGKGIYDVDAFAASLAGRVPDNTMLSHDLFEGIFARAALVSDVEVIEDFPARYDVAVRRQHRWVRGDWQLLPWLFGRSRHIVGGIQAVGRWKMLDNLRRALIAPATFAALVAGWFMPLPMATIWTVAVLCLLALPRLLALPFEVLPVRAGVNPRAHFSALGADAASALLQVALNIAFLPDTAWQMGDAIGRTLFRLRASKKHLLEWVTAAQSGTARTPGVVGQVRTMAGGVALGLGCCAMALLINPAVWPLLLPFAALWSVAPILAVQVSRPRRTDLLTRLTADQALSLRLIARRTWRYFETFVTEADNYLPPDNFQETPKAVVARRTSPTNIGLYLLSIVAARDMGWIGPEEALRRLEQTLTRMQAMQRFRGHFYNWYDTADLRVLDPAYVSSVDSGNLAGHLIAVAQACRDWARGNQTDGELGQGLSDALCLAQEALGAVEGKTAGKNQLSLVLARLRADVVKVIEGAPPDYAALIRQADDIARKALILDGADSELAFWTGSIRHRLSDRLEDEDDGIARSKRLVIMASLAHQFATEMDFRFLLQPDKELLSIGFSLATNSLDANCYDLLASEARLASFFAIAKGDVDTRHWFRLGRAATPLGSGSALISWSGSMFEYLMPSLVMRAPAGSVLEQTNRLIVARQRQYGQAMDIPWGISESSYNARDLEVTYQYSNFGVPGLGLKRGLSQNLVIAPYATGLACMVDPVAAADNFARLAALGAEGRYGFYEALDFTPSRLPEGQDMVIVRSFMAHHQGMTITAIANALQDGRLRGRFHADPMIQAADLLMQERVPRDVATARPHAEEVKVGATDRAVTSTVRRFDVPAEVPPTAHLLSNGEYGVMLTPTGGGYSRWRDLAITRWRADGAQETLGSFIFARDTQSGAVWSAGVQPTGANPTAHRAVFCEHHAAFTFHDKTLTTTTEVVVSAEDDAEARRVTLTNTGRRPREVDLTSYAELVLARPASDLAHPAFSKMFVVTDYLPELGVIIATRRRRSPDEPEVWAAHVAVVEGDESAPIQIETDRARFIGRGRTIDQALMRDAPLSGTVGTVLDPIFSIRRRVSVPAGGKARVTFWTLVAATSPGLLDLLDRHRDPSAFGRATTLAWTYAQVQMRHLGITSAEAADFQKLAGFILRGDRRLRPGTAQIVAGIGPQSGLWPHGISGDLPIVLMLIDAVEDLVQLRQILAAHEYWRTRQMAVDLVILNERSASYVQDLQTAIDAAVRVVQIRPRVEGGTFQVPGSIHTLRADLITAQAHALLLAVAKVVLVASRGSIGQQIDAVPEPVTEPAPPLLLLRPASDHSVAPDLPELEFFCGLGGFASEGREYVTILRDGATTPAPWINVIANPAFGFQVSAEGSGHVWSENSRENQITPWSNDPVTDAPGDAIYLRDLDSGAVWTPTALPIRGTGIYVARHGFGYSGFEHTAHGIAARMTLFVPLEDSVRITRLRLQNLTGRTRRLSVTAYAEWVLGASRSATTGFVTTEMDRQTGSMMARNPWSSAFQGRVAFADIGAPPDSWTADRSELLGPGGSMATPAGLNGQALSGRVGAGLDSCAALQRHVTLAPGQTIELRLLLGQAEHVEAARAVIARHRDADLDAMLAEVTRHWNDLLTAVLVKTPDRAMDILLNGWLLYQTLACRIWARAGFYQASGAYGFRDQLQDGMALTFSRPDMTRAHLLRAAARQFPEGDVQHWWLPHSGQGVRTRISDDRVWLGYGLARYVAVSGDVRILDEQVPFLEGPTLPPGSHDDFFLPTPSEQTASMFEHCARGIDQCLTLTGKNGMPLIGTGDWNDGMNRVGEAGKGTSVWLGWLLIATIALMAPLADSRDKARARRWRAHAERVRAAIERDGWDGEWYRRGTYDDGSLLGSASSEECQIDSIAQSWAVLSGAADPARAATAMASSDRHLIRPDPGLALLFTPPFVRTPLDPGYIKGYPPGLRENGGQYSHAAMWAVLAHARLGDGDRAAALFAMLNPINHALTPAAVEQYKVEPYVIAADVYSTAPHAGRGGWTWYTGSAGWMYRAGIEGILGLSRSGDQVTLSPCIPAAWAGLSATVKHADTILDITVENPNRVCHGIVAVTLDDVAILHDGGAFTLALTGGHRRLDLVLGTPV